MSSPLPSSTVSNSTYFNTSLSASPSVKKIQFKGPPPASAHYMALDETTGAIVAYGTGGKYLGHFNATIGNLLQRRDTTSISNCRDATTDEISTIPGWSTFVAGMTSWAAGQAPHTNYVNDKSYPAVWASVCYSTEVVSIQPDSDPSCSAQSTSVNGNAQGNENASLHTEIQQGVSTSYSTTTEQTTQFSWGEQISVTANLELASISVQQSLSLSLTNTHGSQQTSTKDDQYTTDVSWVDEPGEVCAMQLNVSTCTFSAQNTLDFYLTGFIWASFKTWFRDPSCTSALTASGGACANLSGKDLDKCYDNNQCAEHGHWASTAESFVPNEADRSHPMSFASTFATSADTTYQLVCNPIQG
ncbi:hypothetical protein B0H13DRAFT_2347905 [Mycena leptocephala]|nr:hypothetical protein B0H13DRAFT_2347905 [Mycena leptocephala]